MGNTEYPYVEPAEDSGEGYISVDMNTLYLDSLHSTFRLTNDDVSQTGVSFETIGNKFRMNINIELSEINSSNFIGFSLSKTEAQALYKQLGASLEAFENGEQWRPETMKADE